ncbi:MAG: hypothetical protein AB7G12_09605 [Thermoanaerobaculia bacterium]
MELKGRYSRISQLRAAFSLAVWTVLLVSFLAYAMKGGPEGDRKIAFAIFLLVVAAAAVAVARRQIQLTSVVRADDLTLSLHRMGRTLATISWPEVVEVVPVGRLGGFEVRSADEGRKIVVEHLLSNAAEIRALVRARTGK